MLRDAWERTAKDWIAWARAPGFDRYWLYHRDEFLPLVPPPGRLTVDVGCGEGRLARDLGRLGHRIVAIDASPAMATAAAEHSDAMGDVLTGEAASLPLADAAADCVVAFMSLQDVDNMEAAVAECARVLAPQRHLVMAITHPANTAGEFGEADDATGPPFVIKGVVVRA